MKEITVRQVFERAYGPLEDLATCHIGHWAGDYKKGWMLEPTTHPFGSGWPKPVDPSSTSDDVGMFTVGRDISDMPARAYLPIFYAFPAYSQALRELEVANA